MYNFVQIFPKAKRCFYTWIQFFSAGPYCGIARLPALDEAKPDKKDLFLAHPKKSVVQMLPHTNPMMTLHVKQSATVDSNKPLQVFVKPPIK